MLSKNKVIAFLSTFGVIALWSTSAFAQNAAVAAGDNIFTMFSWMAVAAGFGIGLAAIGGALGQGRAAAAALEGIARNPGASGKLLTPLILGLALIESLVIYAFVITILITNQIDAATLVQQLAG
ncbi:ATP synthase F0 subunit C [Persicimonas caeni]|jgi:F-type H+-transporting ATPase subunit c|uniref:ATP synthase subunit c n=1 Tax=Persicimonas caeni TaxID=2292766 RepID=A0A4Y6PR70_PERCE|nr:ATP synthase F0 subunit C [Persicimonas caeni]QDG50824.1 ATP synthase F0 subunit C [Persicimonas caeni]QED32045.1 ATP synthase F0 subunit C [Persicimonas caeni]